MAEDPRAAKTPVARTRRRIGLGLAVWLIGTLFVVVLPVALLGTLTWTVGTDRGLAWVLAHQEFVEVTNLKGSLLDGFSADRIVVSWGAKRENRAIIEAPRASALRLSPGGPQSWLRIHAAQASADRVSVHLAPSPAAPQLPSALRLPIEVEIDAASVATLVLPGLEAHPVRQASGRLHVGATQGVAHRAEALRFAIGPLQWSGSAQIGSDSDLPLRLSLQATQATDAQAPKVDLPAWARGLRPDLQARLDAQGPLAHFALTLLLRAQGQQLDATAEVTPLAPWPLPRLDARTRQLDLSALLTDAPATALTGEVHIAPVALAAGQAPTLSARTSLVNERPGRWDQRALPVRSIAFDLRAQPGAAGRFELIDLRAVLAAQGRDAGSVRGSGAWNAGEFSAKAQLAKVQPHLLDPRLAAMTLSGPLNLTGQISPTLKFDLKADLEGQVENDAARAVDVKVDVAGSAQLIEVRRFDARAGAARLSLAGSARRTTVNAPWQLAGKGDVVDFDPLPWFPGEPDSAWRRGPHRFTGDADFAFTLPANAPAPATVGEWVEWLPTLQGDARLTLRPSQLAGVALRGEAALKSVSPTRARLSGRLELAGNSATAQGEWGRGDAGRSDRWEIDLNAPQLARLAPLRALANVPASWATPAGGVEANVKLEGRWPQLRSQGKLKSDGMRFAQASVARAQARWSFDLAPDSPFELNLGLIDARWEGQQAQSVQLNLQGTARAHALELRTVLNAAPPAWTDFLLGQRPADAAPRPTTLLHLDARGGLPAVSAGTAPRWQGTLQAVDVRGNAKDAAPLLRLQDVTLAVQIGDAQTPASVEVQPGRGDLLGATLRWERLYLSAATAAGAAQFDVKAEIEPIAVAPLLARAQPQLGWRGDLRVGGQVLIRSAPSFNADIVLGRTGGDLSISDETGTQALQLTDLRLALLAKDGVWSFSQALAGKTLGEAAGAVTARVAAPQFLPGADTPIQGVIEARVANLGTWGAWVPPGWRLAGSLQTSAVIGGRLGAPEYTGQIRGTRIGVRNIVEGVNVTDGEVDIKLQGANARIERFEAKAAGGTIALEGGANLGETPNAQLQLTANKFQLLGRVDRRIVASGSAKLELTAKTVNLQGRFNVDEGLIDFTRGDAPSLADDVRVSARPGAVEPEPGPVPGQPRGLSRDVAIDLQVALGEQLRVRGRGLDTKLRGNLRLTTPGGKLAVDGTVSTFSGTYAAYGQKLSIERGELSFVGPAENPRLDIIATRPNLEQIVGVAVTGTALNPRVRLFSDPEMADIDKLSWLVLGRPSDGLGRTDTALLQRAVIGLLAGEGSGPTDQLISAVGLDEVSFRQTEGEVRETVVSLGKQLSRRWYVGYERSLNATTGNWQLIYRIAQRLTLRAQSGLDNSLDAIWTWRWQ